MVAPEKAKTGIDQAAHARATARRCSEVEKSAEKGMEKTVTSF